MSNEWTSAPDHVGADRRLIAPSPSLGKGRGGSGAAAWQRRPPFQRALHKTVPDGLDTAFLTVDANGAPVSINHAGVRLLGRGRFIRLSRRGTLAPGDGVRDPAACTQALERIRRGFGAALLLTDAQTRDELVLIASPANRAMRARDPRNGVVASLWLASTRPDPRAVRRIAELFVLTVAEQRLLSRLVQGDALAIAAEALQISVHTARFQLKSIFSKTGRRTQGQLLALVQRLGAIGPR